MPYVGGQGWDGRRSARRPDDEQNDARRHRRRRRHELRPHPTPLAQRFGLNRSTTIDAARLPHSPAHILERVRAPAMAAREGTNRYGDAGARPITHLRRDWARRCHICAGTGAHPTHVGSMICIGTGVSPEPRDGERSAQSACGVHAQAVGYDFGGLLRGLCRALTCVTRGRLECIMLLHARRVGCGADSLVTSGADVGPSPGVDVGAVSPVPVPMWQR
jgi:hypothetical protein